MSNCFSLALRQTESFFFLPKSNYRVWREAKQRDWHLYRKSKGSYTWPPA